MNSQNEMLLTPLCNALPLAMVVWYFVVSGCSAFLMVFSAWLQPNSPRLLVSFSASGQAVVTGVLLLLRPLTSVVKHTPL